MKAPNRAATLGRGTLDVGFGGFGDRGLDAVGRGGGEIAGFDTRGGDGFEIFRTRGNAPTARTSVARCGLPGDSRPVSGVAVGDLGENGVFWRDMI